MNIPVVWNRWWILMWIVVAAIILTSAFFVSFGTLSLMILFGFGIPEAIGIYKKKDSLPPLTYVIRRYIPRWLTFTAMGAYVGAFGAYWFGFKHIWRWPLFMGLIFWTINHFIVTYDGPGE